MKGEPNIEGANCVDLILANEKKKKKRKKIGWTDNTHTLLWHLPTPVISYGRNMSDITECQRTAHHKCQGAGKFHCNIIPASYYLSMRELIYGVYMNMCSEDDQMKHSSSSGPRSFT
jgi:hypothetical protein